MKRLLDRGPNWQTKRPKMENQEKQDAVMELERKSDTLSWSLKSENDTLSGGTYSYPKIYECPPPGVRNQFFGTFGGNISIYLLALRARKHRKELSKTFVYLTSHQKLIFIISNKN